MSKAFTKEDDAGLEEREEAAAAAPAPSGGKRYITPEGMKRVQAELERLWTVERPRVVNEVSNAAAMGDRSENAEYIYGKKKLGEIDRRMRYLATLVDRLTVVEIPRERAAADDGKVFFGAWVTVEDEDGVETTYRIVGPDETDARTRRVSVESPLARALLGKRVGDEVDFRRPKGPTVLTLVAVRYTPPPGDVGPEAGAA